MPLNFEKHAQKGNRFLNELASKMGNKTDKDHAGRILRAVFRTLRNHLTVEESFQLLAQLPMALKAVYVDGWIPMKKPKLRSRKGRDFLVEVLLEEGPVSWRDFSTGDEIGESVSAVFVTLKKHISEGEYKDMEAVLPKQLKNLLEGNPVLPPAKKRTVLPRKKNMQAIVWPREPRRVLEDR